MAGAKMSVPFAPASATVPGDQTLPTFAVNPVGGATPETATEANSVSVTSDGQVFFTTDGSAVRCALDADNLLRWRTLN